MNAMKRGATGLVVIAAILAPLCEAQSTDAQALAYALGLDVTSKHIVAYCERNGAANATRMQTAWQAWRAANRIDALQAQLPANLKGTLEQRFAALAPSIEEKMRTAGEANAACAASGSIWQSPEFDLRARHPQLFAAGANAGAAAATPSTAADKSTAGAAATANLATGAATANPAAGAATAAGDAAGANASPAKSFDRRYLLQDPAPSGTFYTPAQLRPLVDSWRKSGDYEAAKRAMRDHGPLYIQGKVIKRREHIYLDSNDGVFSAKLQVSPGIDLSMFENQTVTVKGELDELPSSLMFLRKARLVRSAENLKPSTLDAQAGLFRMSVEPARYAAEPGQGITPGEIFGILHHGYGASGVSGYEFREEVRLLLKDGTAYMGTAIAPELIDKDKSRSMQPQLWGKWRKSGESFEIQEQDDRGRAQEWKKAEGSLLPPWPQNHKLTGAYTVQSFSGSSFLGGTYSSSTIVFQPDGRFERIKFSRSSSGSMAQTGSDFSANASSHSDGKGSSSVASANQGGRYTGSSVNVTSQRASNDGAGNRGSYVLSGLSLQMKYDDGKVENLLCAPWNTKYDYIVLAGRTYSRKK